MFYDTHHDICVAHLRSNEVPQKEWKLQQQNSNTTASEMFAFVVIDVCIVISYGIHITWYITWVESCGLHSCFLVGLHRSICIQQPCTTGFKCWL